MSKEVETITKGFVNSGIVGKILITFFVIFLFLFAWNVFQSNVVLQELVKGNKNVESLIQEQAEIKVFRRCVKEEYDITMKEFNCELLKILGNTLSENGITFPQELNESILQFREKAEKIKDCLIFPEDLK